MLRRPVRRALVVAAFIALPGLAAAATSLTGTTGLLFVPVAGVTENERFSFGGVITDYQAFPAKKFSHFVSYPPDFYFGGYLAIGYIPRLEITIRGNGMPGAQGPWGENGTFYLDGMISAQALLFRGRGPIPAIAVGIQDIYGFTIFQALYAVTSWKKAVEGRGNAIFTAGWAVPWIRTYYGTEEDETTYPVNHILDGPMAGIEYPVRRWAAAIVEYDSRSVNVGARLRPAPWVTIDLAAARWGLDELAEGRIRGFAAQLHFDGGL